MAAQREELKKAKDATKEARAEARERLKDLRQNFVKQQIVNRKEIHDRLQEIKGKLRNDQSKPTGQATDGTLSIALTLLPIESGQAEKDWIKDVTRRPGRVAWFFVERMASFRDWQRRATPWFCLFGLGLTRQGGSQVGHLRSCSASLDSV